MSRRFSLEWGGGGGKVSGAASFYFQCGYISSSPKLCITAICKKHGPTGGKEVFKTLAFCGRPQLAPDPQGLVRSTLEM